MQVPGPDVTQAGVCFLNKFLGIHMRYGIVNHTNPVQVLGERNELSGSWAFLEMIRQDERSWLHREKERASDKHAESEDYG